MGQNIYCKIKEKRDDSAIYNVGTDIHDMTAEVQFFKDLRAPTLLKQADIHPVWNSSIARIYGRYCDEFKDGLFREKLSLEIG